MDSIRNHEYNRKGEKVLADRKTDVYLQNSRISETAGDPALCTGEKISAISVPSFTFINRFSMI